MNKAQLEHIIRAAGRIADDKEIVVIGSQAIHAQTDIIMPPIAFMSNEADVYPRNHPDRADDIDGAIGELSDFHDMYGYYAQGISPKTAILAEGWEDRLIPVNNENTDGITGLCINVHDLALSKYAAGREKDFEFNRALVDHEIVDKKILMDLLEKLPVSDDHKRKIAAKIDLLFQP